MIRVTVELVSAQTGKTSTLHQAFIWNDATGSPEVGNYKAVFSRKGGFTWSSPRGYGHPFDARNRGRTAAVKGFPRLRKNALHLLGQVLDKAGYVPHTK